MGASAALSAPDEVPQPVTTAGPYTIAIDRISQNRQLGAVYGLPGKNRGPGNTPYRRVQLQLSVKAADRNATSALATFSLGSVSVMQGGRAQSLVYTGGPLEASNDTTTLRAYLYLSQFPAEATEIRTLEGEIVSYENAAELDLNIPLTGKSFPLVHQQDGVTATVREVVTEAGMARVTVQVDAPNGVLVCGVTDGTYGVSMSTTEGRIAPNVGGTMTQARPNTADYKVSFQNVRGAPASVRIKVLHRSGRRLVHPFRLERVPIPVRPASTARQEGERGKQ